MKRALAIAFVCLLLAAGATAMAAWRFAHAPLPLPQTPFRFAVEKGASLKAVSRKLTDAGLLPEPNGLWWLGRLTGEAGAIQAGTYLLEAPLSPLALLRKMADGDVMLVSITFVEGITFRDMRRLVAAHPEIRQTLVGVTDRELLQRLGAAETHPEGLFFPDTYRFSPGTSDLELLRTSYRAMQKRLADAWSKRRDGLPYASPYEALIMASIVEKETGRSDERSQVAAVFVNRLRLPMRLQTDPTVIYGMGERYDGNIRKRDLAADTPYNTYTRDGLPPTPIALPGAASILAATQPAESDHLYFVAKGEGDGSHRFSRTLDEHNRAVAQYLKALGKK